jgi:hypothetical protein
MDLENKKIWIGQNPVLCAQVQRKLFEMGYTWSGREKAVKFTNATMFFLRRGELVYSSEPSREKFDHGYRGYSDYEEILLEDLGIGTKIDLENKKIWIGKNPKLSTMVQEKAFKLGWRWTSGHATAMHTEAVFLVFNDKTISFGTVDRNIFETDQPETEIFPRDLGIDMENSYEPRDEEKIKMDLKELLGQIKGL